MWWVFLLVLLCLYHTGNVGIYDEKFRLQRQYEIDIDTDPDADLDVAASDPGWITDALWMDNSKHAVYTTSLRTMHFFDASASVHYEEYRAFGFHRWVGYFIHHINIIPSLIYHMNHSISSPIFLHINEIELQILSSTLTIEFRTLFSAFQLALTIHSTQTSQMTLPFCT